MRSRKMSLWSDEGTKSSRSDKYYIEFVEKYQLNMIHGIFTGPALEQT